MPSLGGDRSIQETADLTKKLPDYGDRLAAARKVHLNSNPILKVSSLRVVMALLLAGQLPFLDLAKSREE
jgi:hypothetical protein